MSTRERSRPVPAALVALSAIPLLVAISALWLTLCFEAQPGTGYLLHVLRLVFGSAMAACLAVAERAIRGPALRTRPQRTGALS